MNVQLTRRSPDLGIRDALPRRPEFLAAARETGVQALLASERQIAQFEKIHDDYVAHYYDAWSMRYREEFIFPFISNGQDLNGKRVAELACGSGYNSLALRQRFPSVHLTGFDISPSACADYARNLGAPATEVDLTRPIDVADRFDLAFVIGGLHHCVADLDQTLRNVAKILTPGGFFVMLEPNAQFFLEGLRKIWYRLDGSFDAATEHALNHDELLKSAEQYFRCTDVRYFGGPGYFGVLNSMILRIPLKAKPVVSPPLIAMERCWNASRAVGCTTSFSAAGSGTIDPSMPDHAAAAIAPRRAVSAKRNRQ